MTTVPKDAVAGAVPVPVQGSLRVRPTVRHLVVVATIVIAALIPLVAKSFVLFQLTEVMIYGLAILGLNLLTGFNGQFSLGHSAFYGLGAYTAAILIHNYEVSYLWTLPAAGGVPTMCTFSCVNSSVPNSRGSSSSALKRVPASKYCGWHGN